MLKRTNIHFEEENLATLDDIVRRVNEELNEKKIGLSITRSDLVRFAISRTYGIGFCSLHISKDQLWDMIRLVRHNLPE